MNEPKAKVDLDELEARAAIGREWTIDERFALIAELRELRGKAEWVGWHPTSELPPDGRVVLVGGDGFQAVSFRMGDEWFQTDCDTADGEHPIRSSSEVTRWHELPDDPPEESR